MLGTVRIQGADATANNTDGDNWEPSARVATSSAHLCKVVAFVPSTVTANRVLWFFNSGSIVDNALNDPEMVLVCPPGYTTTLDFGDYGKLFTKGLVVTACTNEPADATTARVLAANNEVRWTVDYKVK